MRSRKWRGEDKKIRMKGIKGENRRVTESKGQGQEKKRWKKTRREEARGKKSKSKRKEKRGKDKKNKRKAKQKKNQNSAGAREWEIKRCAKTKRASWLLNGLMSERTRIKRAPFEIMSYRRPPRCVTYIAGRCAQRAAHATQPTAAFSRFVEALRWTFAAANASNSVKHRSALTGREENGNIEKSDQ